MLTKTERKILKHSIEFNTKEIATLMGVSRRTVEFHLLNSYRKLGVNRLIAAVEKARSLNLI